ncbi:hypothetical protein ACWEN6_24935 [Sphaerisporangium sp. NPDC004334]
MDNLRPPTLEETATGWRIFRSDRGRYWATRERRFDEAAEKAGAWRTVDGDDLPGVCMRIAAQEALAEMAPNLAALAAIEEAIELARRP